MLSIRRVLFPTDFSVGAKRAFPLAAHLADWHDAELHVLNVTGRHRHDYEEQKEKFPLSLDLLTGWLGRPSASVSGTNWPDLEALPITQKQVESAEPAEQIVTYAEDEEIDLIATGTHGRRGVDRMLFGSVTEEVVRNAACPVLTIRTEIEETPDQEVRRILVPVDFSDASEAAVEHATELAQTYDAQIDLLHVVEEVTYPSAYGVDPVYLPPQEIIPRVEKSLGEIARDGIGHEDVGISATVGYAPFTILDHINSNDIDLVVIATHGRTGFDRMLLGSVAERVIRRSPVPVFVVKPEQTSLLPAVPAGAADET